MLKTYGWAPADTRRAGVMVQCVCWGLRLHVESQACLRDDLTCPLNLLWSLIQHALLTAVLCRIEVPLSG